MVNRSKSWLAALCLSTAALFFAQVMLCSADETGMISCVQDGNSDEGSPPGKCGETPATHSCHCTAHASILPWDSESVFGVKKRDFVYFEKSDFVPEGSAREIDYPPRLS